VRPDKEAPETLGFATQAVHAGNAVDAGSGAIRTPLVMANSYALPAEPEDLSWSGFDVPTYTRNTGANQRALQSKLAHLEQGEDAVVLATGVAALHAVFFTFLRTGEHAVVSDVTYEATHRLFAEILPQRYGVEATFVDTSDPDAVRAATSAGSSRRSTRGSSRAGRSRCRCACASTSRRPSGSRSSSPPSRPWPTSPTPGCPATRSTSWRHGSSAGGGTAG
jgi:hypothetical protein